MPVCMSDGAVDEHVPQSDEHQHGGVLHAISEATTDQCRSDDSEGQLVCGKKRLYNKHEVHTSTLQPTLGREPHKQCVNMTDTDTYMLTDYYTRMRL